MLFELGDLLGSSLLRNFFSVARVIFSRKITVLAQKTTQKKWLFLGQNLFFTKPFLFNYLKTVICELMLLELGELLGLSFEKRCFFFGQHCMIIFYGSSVAEFLWCNGP